MDKFKRNERLAVMTKILSDAPNRIFTLSFFCEMFGAAKSTVSEDASILAGIMQDFKLGTLETVTGAAGGRGPRIFGRHLRKAAFPWPRAAGRLPVFFGYSVRSPAGIGHGQAVCG